MSTRRPVEVDGCSLLRYQLLCSLLSNRPVTIRRIGVTRESRGLCDYEVNLLKFLDRATSGTKMEVRHEKTELFFDPGMILGGVFSHTVPTTRSVAYIMEIAMLLLPFAKHASEVTFLGCTQHDLDLAPDTLRTVTVRWLRLFGVECSLRIVRRGAAPDGDGCVVMTIGNVRRLRSVTATARGKVRRVRGIVYSSNVSADLTKRAATASKGALLNFLPDVYVVADSYSSPPGKRTAGTNGYGLMLVAESTEHTMVVSQEIVARHNSDPEALGVEVAHRLLDEISQGGCVDAHHQLFVLMLVGCSPDEVSTVRFGSLTPSAVSGMQLLETFFGVTCAVKQEDNSYAVSEFEPSTLVSAIGSNVLNVAKKSG